jgi:hypothetical protein
MGTLVLLAGCDQVFLGERPAVDAAIDVPVGPFCYGRHGKVGAGLLRICLDEPPAPTWEDRSLIVTGMMSTDCTESIAQDGKDLCVIAAHDITISMGFKASGGRPLVFLAERELRIEAGVTINLVNGPAADDKDCARPLPTGNGGGAGGAYATSGGKGGNGETGAGAAGTDASGPPVTLRGGCDGTRGADASGGHSGGAIYLIAGESMTIAGTINASGEGGKGGVNGSGGAGGGSGGYIGLDAPSLTLAGATLMANGGGGGGGAGTPGTVGTNGETSNRTGTFPYPALGGMGAGGGITGGRGGYRTSPAQPGSSSATGGGGGGGGGVGYIWVYAQQIDAQSTQATPDFIDNAI